MAAVLKDKIPPHDPNAEQATLGALLLDADAIAAVLQFVKEQPKEEMIKS